MIVLFMFCIKPLRNAKTATEDGSIDTNAHFVSPAAPTVNAGDITPSASMPDTMETDVTIHAEYDFSLPVPVSAPVENNYFDDAVLIGDSRTEGLLLNTGLSNATSYAYQGLMVDTVFTKPVINKDGQKLSVIDALKSTSFSKVYIMLGINETGWVYSQVFQQKYGEIIDGMQRIQRSRPQRCNEAECNITMTDWQNCGKMTCKG